MKTLQRFKKVIRNTLCSFICVSFFVVSSISSANAASYLTYTSHGYTGNLSWTTQKISDATNATATVLGDLYYTHMTVTFGDCQTGTCTITVAYYNAGSVFICEGCRLTSWTQNSSGQGVATFQFYAQDTLKIDYYHAYLNASVSAFSGSWNREAYSEITAIKNIYGYIDDVEDSLSNIYNYLSTLNNSIGSTNSLLTSTNSILQNISTQISKIHEYPIWQQNILMWSINYDGLKFDSTLPYITYNSSSNNSTYTAAKRLCVQPNSTFSLIFYSSANINLSDITLYYPSSYTVSISRSYAFTPPGSMFLYRYDFINSDNALHYFEIEIGKNTNIYPLFWGNINMIPDDVHLLYGDDYDNTYTRLLNQMINAIGTISQTQIVENNTNINNYNNYQQQINNVENNYYQQFNTVETNIENNNTFDFTGLSSDGVQVYNNLFSNVYGISLVKWPVLITLLGLVIVIILG